MMTNPFDKFDAGNAFDKFDRADATPSAELSRTARYARGVKDPIDAGAQLLTKLLPESVVNAGNRLNNFLARTTGLVDALPEGGVDEQVRRDEAAYQARRAAAGQEGFDGYRLTGNIINPTNLAIGARLGTALPQAAGLAARAGTGAVGGAVSGALTPVTSGDDFASEKAKQVALGAGFGGLIPAASSGIARVVNPRAAQNTALQQLRAEGVRPTIGQALGGNIGRAEEKLQSLPILGDAISSARRGANSSFEAAAHNRALAPIGVELPAGLKGRDAINFTEQALGAVYDDVLTRIGALRPDQQLATKVTDLTNMLNKSLLPRAEKNKFRAAVNELQESIDSNGVMTSDAFKRLESSLGTYSRQLGSTQNIYDNKISGAVKQLQEELRDMLGRQAGPEAAELKAINTGYANFKRVQRAAASTGAETGEFTPAQFQAAVKALDKSKDKGAFARGSALGQDLGDAGKTMLGGKVPNSGSTDRLLLNAGVLGGGAALSPAALFSALGAGALYLPPAQRALVASVASRPQSAKQVADALRQASVPAVPFITPVGLPLLNQ